MFKILNDPFVVLVIGLSMPVLLGLFLIFFTEVKEDEPKKTGKAMA